MEQYFTQNPTTEKEIYKFDWNVGKEVFNFYTSESLVTMCDVNERALELSKMNAKENKVDDRIKIIASSAFENIKDNYDIIMTNPPIRAGKDLIFSFYEGAYKHLNKGGKLYVVIQKKQGALSTKAKLESLFGNCEIADKKSGYFIFRSIRE